MDQKFFNLINNSFSSAKQEELAIFINILSVIHKSLSIVSHSGYLKEFFQQWTHTCTQYNLTGFIAKLNKQADSLTSPIFTSPEHYKMVCICHFMWIH